MNALRKTLLALGIVAFAQTVVLAWMVIDRVRLIKTGREIVLPIVPVDPRDLFRGEFVRLGYDINRVPLSLLKGTLPKQSQIVYVTLGKQEDGTWRAVGVAGSLSAGNADQIVLKGRVTAIGWGGIRYGIESYFVPEGEGRRLEALAREKKLAALVAVDGAGNAAIKGLIIDGKLQYEEPLF
jgi:uncharacterized membrane-anchored protein